MSYLPRLDGLSVVEDALGPGPARLEACKKYRVGNRFPPGPCRTNLPKGATAVDGPAQPVAKKKAAKTAAPAPQEQVDEQVAQPVAPKAARKLTARQLFAPAAQKDLKPVKDPAKLALLGGVYEVTHAAMSSKVTTVTANNNKVVIDGLITGPDGSEIGQFKHEIRLDRRGGMYADLSLINIEPQFQGQGFAKAQNSQAFAWYRDSGMDRVQLFANIDVGALAWARGGWDWASRFDTQVLQDRLAQMARGKDKYAAGLAKDMLARFDAAQFGSPQYPTPFELSQMGRRDGQAWDDTWPGTVLFRSHPDPEHPEHLGWNAEMRFTRPVPALAAALGGGGGGGGRVEMIGELVAAHDQWVERHLDSTAFAPRPGSRDFNLYYVDVDASGDAQDGLAAAMNAVLQPHAAGTAAGPTGQQQAGQP